MSLKSSKQQIEDELTITEEREDFMVPSSSDGNPTFRIAHFLKPLLNTKLQPLPKTPFVSLSSNPNIINNVAKEVCFRGSNNSLLSSWKPWVDDLAKTHENIWKKVGIFDAIKGSTYHIKRDNQLVMCLAERWCTETNTFVFSWGECTVTLEDVMVLGGFPVMGDSVLTQLSHSKKFAEIEGKLVKSCSVISKHCNQNLSHNGWMDYYKGYGGDIEHAAFLVLWLSRYVLPLKLGNRINRSVFGVAISLTMGTKIALAPVVLASIYRDLTLLNEKIACHNVEGVVVSSSLALCAPLQFVQLWAWERFMAFSPKPTSLIEGQPRMARWHNVTKLKTSSLRLDIESHADSFIWRPYALYVKHWQIPKFYCDDGMWVVINSEVEEELLSYVKCLRASELVGLDCVMQYLPHRVGMQFGMDQDIPNSVPRSNANFRHALRFYDRTIEGLKLYLPPRLFEGAVTVQYARWWRPLLTHDDDAFATYPRRKRSMRKRKRYCNDLQEMESQKQQNVVNGIASSTTLNEQEDTSIHDAYTIPEKDKRKIVNEHPKEISARDVEAVSSGVAGSGNMRIEPQFVENVASVIESVIEMLNSLQIGVEDEKTSEHCAVKIDMKKEASESNKNMGEGGKSTKDNGEGPSIETEINALKDENGNDVQRNAEENPNTNQPTTSANDIVLISDEEGDCNSFDELFMDFEARINELDKVVSALKAAKSRAMRT